jgi:hypothetical protein
MGNRLNMAKTRPRPIDGIGSLRKNRFANATCFPAQLPGAIANSRSPGSRLKLAKHPPFRPLEYSNYLIHLNLSFKM